MMQPHYPASNAAVSGEVDKVFGVWHIAAFLLQNRKAIADFHRSDRLCRLIYLLFATPVFVATTSVIIDTNRGAEMFNATPMSPPMTSDQSRVESQIEVIKSDRVANSVISRLKLEQRPEFVSGPSVVQKHCWRGSRRLRQRPQQGRWIRRERMDLREVAVAFC